MDDRLRENQEDERKLNPRGVERSEMDGETRSGRGEKSHRYYGRTFIR
jgi:hypothetical protein